MCVVLGLCVSWQCVRRWSRVDVRLWVSEVLGDMESLFGQVRRWLDVWCDWAVVTVVRTGGIVEVGQGSWWALVRQG